MAIAQLKYAAGGRSLSLLRASRLASFRDTIMQLHVLRPSIDQTESVSEIDSKDGAQHHRASHHTRSPFSVPQARQSSGDRHSQHLARQLAKANQYGHHFNQLPAYSQVGYGMPIVSKSGSGCGWPLQRYPDRSAKENHTRVLERSPVQPSHQPVQFIFGWVLRKMVRSTMGWLFPK